MSTGLRAPTTRGMARPAPTKKAGLAKAGVVKTPSGNAPAKSGSREAVGATPARSASRGVLKPSASNHSIGGLSRSDSSVSVSAGMSPLKPGTRVVMKDTNIEGTVRFYGEPQFARGTWVGVELDVEQGKNNGEVKGVKYFTCQPNYGLFCKRDKLKVLKEAQVMRPLRTPSQVNVSKVDYEAKFGLHVGARVVVNGAKPATLLFLGLTNFAKGVWAGVALDTNDGKNDGSVKGDRYFTCEPGHGLFAQATKIKMLESPFTSSSSLSSFETPRKNDSNTEDVMKPDFVNRTPASTPGVTSSLSGILRSKSRDIESMQKNIGDLQQRLNEVNKTPTRNGPSIQNSQTQHKVNHNNSSDQYEKLKKIHDDSEKERSQLVEKVKALETDKLTYETRIAEVAEAASTENSSLNHRLDQQNKEIAVLNSNNSAQISKLQDDLLQAETELAVSLEKITDYEGSALQNDNSAELTMNREKISELQAELKSLRSCQECDKNRITELETQLSDAHRRSETAQNELNSKLSSLQGDSAELQKSQSRISELERLLSEAQESLHNLQNSSDNQNSELISEQQSSAKLVEDIDNSKNHISELEAEIMAMRSAHESSVLISDKKHSTLLTQLTDRDQTIGSLKTELSLLSSSSSSEKLHLEKKLQDSSSDVARFQEQTMRDAARIADLENLVSSAASDSDSQLIVAHKKISELENRLTEREAESNEKLKEVKETITELQDELSQEKQHSTEQLDEANRRSKELQVTLDQVQMERSMEQTQTEKDIGELQLQLAETDKLNSENSRLKNTINNLQTELSSLQSKSSELQDSNKTVSRLQAQLDSINSEHSNLVASLENNIDELETRLAIVNNDKSAEAELSVKREAEMVEESKNKIGGLEQELEKRAGQLAALETESAAKIAALESQLEQAEQATLDKTTEVAGLRGELETSQSQLESAELQMRDLAEEYDAKRRDLESNITELQRNLALVSEEKTNISRDLSSVTRELAELKVKTNRQSDEEIENLHKQIHNLNEENDMMKLSYNDKNAEFEELTTEVSTLREISETAFSELKKNEEQFTNSVRKLKSTEIQLDEALERMKELQTKINDLEEEVVRERSRANELEQRVHSPPEMSFEYVDNLSNISASPPVSAPSFIPDRMFCDNCDVFDDHDTDNCPIGVSPGGVKHGGHRGLSGRPYCTVCEMFGHTAEECEDDMTF